jgi:menaquinone-dependent protoporphyrinogen oxidase
MLLPRILVLYSTTDGHTRKVACAISETLRTANLDVDVVNAAGRFDPLPEDYDGVIVAAPVRAGRYPKDVRHWVRRHAESLRNRASAFVSVCLSVLDRRPAAAAAIERMLQQFFDETGWHPSVSKVVAGALPYTQYNWLTRWMMRRIVAKAHGDTDTSRDYEYTDWNDLRRFAHDFAGRITGAPAMPIAV